LYGHARAPSSRNRFAVTAPVLISGRRGGRGSRMRGGAGMRSWRGRGRTRIGRGVLAAGAAALLALASLGTGAAATADPLPVPQGFFSGILPELTDPGGSLPGVNDWDCRPGPAHPEPVILIHGTGGGAQ